MRVFESIDEVRQAIGEVIGPGPTFEVSQNRITAFGEATDDMQWIHVDQVRAESGPFHGTIAHGFLTLSLLPSLVKDLYLVGGVGMKINYGLNKVRFPSPLPSDSHVRATATITEVTEVGGGAWQISSTITVTADGAVKPCLVAEWLTRLYPGGD